MNHTFAKQAKRAGIALAAAGCLRGARDRNRAGPAIHQRQHQPRQCRQPQMQIQGDGARRACAGHLRLHRGRRRCRDGVLRKEQVRAGSFAVSIVKNVTTEESEQLARQEQRGDRRHHHGGSTRRRRGSHMQRSRGRGAPHRRRAVVQCLADGCDEQYRGRYGERVDRRHPENRQRASPTTYVRRDSGRAVTPVGCATAFRAHQNR